MSTPLNWNYYKIFVNLDKNKLPDIIKYMEWHNKSELNNYFQKEFQWAFTSLQSSLC